MKDVSVWHANNKTDTKKPSPQTQASKLISEWKADSSKKATKTYFQNNTFAPIKVNKIQIVADENKEFKIKHATNNMEISKRTKFKNADAYKNQEKRVWEAGTGDFQTDDHALELIKMNAKLFTREEINVARFEKFSRYGYLDPYNHITSNSLREYLFFTKPDLHIINYKTHKLNKQLADNAFFIDLYGRYQNVITQLQRSAIEEPTQFPFVNLLSFSVNSSLDLPGISSQNIDTPQTIFGNNYEYRGSGEASDDNPKFSLEFKDTKHLDLYMFFRAYEEYEVMKRHGLVTPPRKAYTKNRVLHDQMGVYKFICADDGRIVHYSYICGVKPENVPRDAFSNISNFDNGITFTIDFTGAFIEDMNPLILRDFNLTTDPRRIACKNERMPLYKGKKDANKWIVYGSGQGYGQFAKTAYVVGTQYKTGKEQRPFYKLVWIM